MVNTTWLRENFGDDVDEDEMEGDDELEDPWDEIEPPSIADSVAARRVDANLPWNFYWARERGRHGFSSRYATPSIRHRPLNCPDCATSR